MQGAAPEVTQVTGLLPLWVMTKVEEVCCVAELLTSAAPLLLVMLAPWFVVGCACQLALWGAWHVCITSSVFCCVL